MKYLVGCLVFVVLALSSEKAAAQDPEFTQFYANPIYLNPAFAGTNTCPRVSLNYRQQWIEVSNAFTTYSASYDQHVKALSGGLGVMVMSDQAGAGTIGTNTASLVYSYQIPITRLFSIQAGAQVSFVQKQINWDDLTFGDMIDPRRGFVYDSQELRGEDATTYPDFSFGALAFSERYFGGFAVHHILEPDESLYPNGGSVLPRKYTVHGGMVIPVKVAGVEKGKFSPNIMYRSQGGTNQINVGAYGTRGPVVGGLWIRNTFGNWDSFIILAGLYQKTYKIGYSYDITVSPLGNGSTGGSHELSFTLNFGCRTKGPTWRTAQCPTF